MNNLARAAAAQNEVATQNLSSSSLFQNLYINEPNCLVNCANEVRYETVTEEERKKKHDKRHKGHNHKGKKRALNLMTTTMPPVSTLSDEQFSQLLQNLNANRADTIDGNHMIEELLDLETLSAADGGYTFANFFQ